jgi:transcriptional regulator with XRE-family HTH domain
MNTAGHSADLAAKIGTDAGQISRYENGRMSPSADAVVRLAEILDVSTDYLPHRQQPPPTPPRSGKRPRRTH